MAGGGASVVAEQPFDGGHRRDQPVAVAVPQRRQHGADIVLHAAFELGEGLASLGGQREPVLPAVRRQRLAGDQAVFVEFLDDAAEVAGIEAEFDPDLLGGQLFPVRQFVQHPRLAQRERAFQQLLIEHAELAGIEPVESPDR